MNLVFRAALGAAVVLLITIVARSRNYYIAGLVPLFPTFALLAHYIVGTERGVPELKAAIVFGMWAVVPYLTYLGLLLALVDRMRLVYALGAALAGWCVAAAAAVMLWRHR
jgi:uncharacterized membrane protein (GlpM family)